MKMILHSLKIALYAAVMLMSLFGMLMTHSWKMSMTAAELAVQKEKEKKMWNALDWAIPLCVTALLAISAYEFMYHSDSAMIEVVSLSALAVLTWWMLMFKNSKNFKSEEEKDQFFGLYGPFADGIVFTVSTYALLMTANSLRKAATESADILA